MSFFMQSHQEPVEVKFGKTPDDTNLVNTVYVKPKLTLSDITAIERGSLQVSAKSTQGKNGRRGVEADDAEVSIPISPTLQMIANLKVAVTGWDGPSFEGVRYSRSAWDKLDPVACLWWISLVNEKIDELNAPATEDLEGDDLPNSDDDAT